MDIDTTADPAADAATATPDAITATPASEPQDGSQHQPSAEVATATTPSDGATQTHQPAEGSGSLAADTRSKIPQGASPATPPNQPAAGDWEKRYNDQLGYMTRLAQERAEYQRKLNAWGDLDPNQVREVLRQREEQAQRLNLKPWHPQHPESARTSSRIDRVSTFKATRDAIASNPTLDRETKQNLISEAAQRARVTDEDVQLWEQHQDAVRDAQERFGRDPEGFVQAIAMPLAQQIAQQMVQQYDQYRTVSMQTEQWFGSNKDALDKYGREVLWAMDDKTPRRDVGLTIAQLKSENDKLRAQLGSTKETVESAAAQQAALKKGATVTRDARTSAPAVDPLKEAEQEGLTGRDLVRHLLQRRREQQQSDT